MNTVCVNTDVTLPPRLHKTCYPNKERLSLRPAGERAQSLPSGSAVQSSGVQGSKVCAATASPVNLFDELALVVPRFSPRVVDNDSEHEDFPPTDI
jgi:hypothetical protein